MDNKSPFSHLADALILFQTQKEASTGKHSVPKKRKRKKN
jgi:hypothetical protein